MPRYGGLSPSPRRYGGGKPLLAFIVQSLQAQLGTALDTSSSSNVYPRIMAYARAITAIYSGNQRLANQFDPQRMTDFLPRWERIFGIIPSPTDTDVARRARVALKFARIGAPATLQVVNDLLTTLLGSAYLGITTNPSASANVFTPTGWPMGQHDATGVIDWYSTIAYIAIKVTKPYGMLDGTFFELLGTIMPILDSLLPAWMAFDWYRQDISNRAGFYLDEMNLDNEALDA